MPASFPRRRALRLALAAPLAVAALPAQAQSVAGSYRVEGRNPDGSSYVGTVRIEDNQGQVSMIWSVAGRTYRGSGSRNGDIVWVDWGDPYPVVYVRMRDGALHGTWANGTALERLTR